MNSENKKPTPHRIELQPGLYSWCTCGLSQKNPFCDGSHHEAEGVFRSLKFEVTETKTVSLCTCKLTSNPPYCDGSHKSL